MDILGFIIVSLAFLLMVRTVLTSRAYTIALDATDFIAHRIMFNDVTDDWRAAYRVYEAHSFNLDVLDLRKWTYEQYFPDVPRATA